MMKPVIVVDAFWRLVDELFSKDDWAALGSIAEIVWGRDEPMPAALLSEAGRGMRYYIAAKPSLTPAQLSDAVNLKAIIEVGGSFPDGLDYDQCFARGIEVLSCAPGFRNSVAEMALAMVLAGGRGLVAEHEAFRRGEENWLNDKLDTDFSLFGQDVGFVGFGSIGRQCAALMQPFAPVIRAYDPWLDPAIAAAAGATLVPLDEVMARSRCVIVAATPTRENRGLVSEAMIARMPRGALLVVISRAHLVDFGAMERAVAENRIRAATDVFPEEPWPRDASIRSLDGIILSPHRAAAVRGGRHLIGAMILADVRRMLAGTPPLALQRADPARIEQLVGISRPRSGIDMATLDRGRG